MAQENRIEITDSNLVVLSTETKLAPIYKTILELIKDNSEIRKVKYWISRLLRKSRKYQKEIYTELEKREIIKIIHKSFLGIKYYRTQLINNIQRDQIIDEIRKVIFNDKDIDNLSSIKILEFRLT